MGFRGPGNDSRWYRHLCELRSRTAGDFLNTQLCQLRLQLAQLLLQVLLVFGPERTRLDFSGGLTHYTLAFRYIPVHHCHNDTLTIVNECRIAVV